jgi:hypothetical protein
MLELVRALPLEDADVNVIGRRLEGSVLRWETLYHVTDDGREWYEEGFLRGCAAYSLRARATGFELRREHRDRRVGWVNFTETDGGLTFQAVMDGDDDGEAELMAVNAGLRRGVSIRYTPRRNEPRHGPPWWRHQIDVRELSLTAAPQFGPDAVVTAVRAHPANRWRPPADRDALLTPLPPHEL